MVQAFCPSRMLGKTQAVSHSDSQFYDHQMTSSSWGVASASCENGWQTFELVSWFSPLSYPHLFHYPNYASCQNMQRSHQGPGFRKWPSWWNRQANLRQSQMRSEQCWRCCWHSGMQHPAFSVGTHSSSGPFACRSYKTSWQSSLQGNWSLWMGLCPLISPCPSCRNPFQIYDALARNLGLSHARWDVCELLGNWSSRRTTHCQPEWFLLWNLRIASPWSHLHRSLLPEPRASHHRDPHHEQHTLRFRCPTHHPPGVQCDHRFSLFCHVASQCTLERTLNPGVWLQRSPFPWSTDHLPPPWTRWSPSFCRRLTTCYPRTLCMLGVLWGQPSSTAILSTGHHCGTDSCPMFRRPSENPCAVHVLPTRISSQVGSGPMFHQRSQQVFVFLWPLRSALHYGAIAASDMQYLYSQESTWLLTSLTSEWRPVCGEISL